MLLTLGRCNARVRASQNHLLAPVAGETNAGSAWNPTRPADLMVMWPVSRG
jgi:hypothetical protein